MQPGRDGVLSCRGTSITLASRNTGEATAGGLGREGLLRQDRPPAEVETRRLAHPNRAPFSGPDLAMG